MERFNPDRSLDLALSRRDEAAPPAPEIVNPPVVLYDHESDAASAAPPPTPFSTPSPKLEPSPLETDLFSALRRPYDAHLRRLKRIKSRLRSLPTEAESLPTEMNSSPLEANSVRPPAKPPAYLLPGTLAYLDRFQYPPLLPAPRPASFEAAFQRHEPMFHTVFYRKYPPWILDDAKQEGLLALFRKWQKHPEILDQKPAYVVTAAIYGVSNWRQKGMKVRTNEGALVVDAHGKVIGEPRSHSQERWTDRIDRRLDVAQAVEVVLYRYQDQPEAKATQWVIDHLRDEIPYMQGQRASGLSVRGYQRHRAQVKADLREQLADYAPQRERPPGEHPYEQRTS